MESSAQLAIGIDIGGTKIAAGLVDANGRVVESLSVPTPAHDAELLRSTVAGIIRDWQSDSVVAAGVAAAGFISRNGGTVYYAPNIQWRNEPLKAQLEAQVAVPVFIENDANAAGWAEYRFGAGVGRDSMVLLTIGTGVGGAIISGGRLLRGGFGAGAELGHVSVAPDGLACGCGQHGCLEQYASGRALMRIANEIADAGGVGLALAQARANDGELGRDNVAALIAAGDPGALAALGSVARSLGSACASLSAVLDPELFVFGGGVSIAGELLLEPLRASYLENLPARGFHPEAEFAVAASGNDAGMVGAADLARAHVLRSTSAE